MASKLSDNQDQLDPLAFLKECKEVAQGRGEARKVQEIRTLIWKIQDMNESPSKREEINKLLLESGLIEKEVKPISKASELSSTEKMIRTNERKLKDIEKLKEKQRSGIKLEVNQLEKISREKELKEELNNLKSIVERVASEDQ